MPNNCSTLIQRKQNIIHKILRSKSERKSLNGEENFLHTTVYDQYLFVETIY